MKKTKKAPKAVNTTRKSKTARRLASAVTDPDAILGRAMLVNVNIGMWEGRKHDQEVTAQVNADNHASADAGRYHKHLFGGRVKELSSIITAAAALRTTHYEQTLPWSDSGWRLLPTENYFAYMEAMRKAITRYNGAADEFESAYGRLVREAQEKLNGMFRPSDYPEKSMVRGKYHVALEYSPLPAGNDFRVTLPSQELARVAKDVEDRVLKSVDAAMHEAWKRLGEAISDLRAKLGDGKYLRDSMIDRLRDMAEVLGRLNLTGDAALETARKRVLSDLTVFDADHLRKDEKVRTEAARRADSILKSMADVYAPSPMDDKE